MGPRLESNVPLLPTGNMFNFLDVPLGYYYIKCNKMVDGPLNTVGKIFFRTSI
jgi:hypothetical protein